MKQYLYWYRKSIFLSENLKAAVNETLKLIENATVGRESLRGPQVPQRTLIS